MNNKISWLLNKATELEDKSLSDDIAALESLGEKAGVRAKEYKSLLAKVNKLIAKDGEAVAKTVDETVDKEGEAVDKTGEKNLYYAGVKMIGSLYYSSKDDYAKGFATADECAEHYNGG